MALIMHSPPVIMEPAEMEDYGAPDYLAHGWTMTFGPELITGTMYIERVDRGVIRRQVVCRAHFPRSHWMRAIETTLIGAKGGPGH